MITSQGRRWSRQARVSYAVTQERWRQDNKWGWPNEGLAGRVPYKKLAILMEEVGEVATALLEREPLENLKAELTQVAAVAIAWLESIEEFGV